MMNFVYFLKGLLSDRKKREEGPCTPGGSGGPFLPPIDVEEEVPLPPQWSRRPRAQPSPPPPGEVLLLMLLLLLLLQLSRLLLAARAAARASAAATHLRR